MRQESGSDRSRQLLSRPPPGTAPRTITRIICASIPEATVATICATDRFFDSQLERRRLQTLSAFEFRLTFRMIAGSRNRLEASLIDWLSTSQTRSIRTVINSAECIINFLKLMRFSLAEIEREILVSVRM